MVWGKCFRLLKKQMNFKNLYSKGPQLQMGKITKQNINYN